MAQTRVALALQRAYELALLYYRSGAYQKAQAVLTQLPAPNLLPAPLQPQVKHLPKERC